jgi:hypothetical protein
VTRNRFAVAPRAGIRQGEHVNQLKLALRQIKLRPGL